jgi:hypothetical protein
MEPLTPAGLDLREFGWMPLDVLRLRDSDLAVLASGDAFRAAVMLWCAAWHQVPAGSLPSDNRLLANLAGYGRDLDGWASVKADAMRGFVECADGRLYHPTVCEDLTEIAAMSFIEQPEELNWDAVLVAYKKTGHWSRFAGNDPSSPNCRCPPEILAKYGLLQQSETMQ